MGLFGSNRNSKQLELENRINDLIAESEAEKK